MTETGIWDNNEAGNHQSSEDLAIYILLLDPGQYVIDMGCGRADYLRLLTDENFEHIIGVEGTVLPEHRGMDIRYLDLSEPIDLGVKGQVLCLEVGEHIPEQYEQTVLDNITKHCNSTLILSWGLPGQPGIGHVNCKPMDYIINEIERRGFKYNKIESELVRAAPHKNALWFKDTLMIFKCL